MRRQMRLHQLGKRRLATGQINAFLNSFFRHFCPTSHLWDKYYQSIFLRVKHYLSSLFNNYRSITIPR